MLLIASIAVPVLAAGLAAALRSDRQRPWVLPIAGAVHLLLTLVVLTQPDVSAFGGWLALDAEARAW